MNFQQELIFELEKFNQQQKYRFPQQDVLKIDLHCHDHNSNIPDELIGRILNLPETWLKTEKLIENLEKNGCNALTITNHNNARSCFDLLDKGQDVLVGAEFSCNVPDFNVGIHVLTYGFTPEQEIKLNKLRKDLYHFLDYTVANDIPTIWAHPLYHYKREGKLPFDFFCKMSLVFERFEVLNGQRDSWQNMLVKSWLETLTPEQIDEFSKKYGINPQNYCRNPYRKVMTGGSDSHMGIFAGLTGSRLYVPELETRLKKEKRSDLALEAIRNGDIAPFGSHQTTEKLTISLLEYVCQIALNYKDPGLMRILLHKGTSQDKILGMVISNAFSEIRRHKVTMNFIKLFHESLSGKKASFTQRLFVPKHYKKVFDDAMSIADAYRSNPKDIANQYIASIDSISNNLNTLLHSRLTSKIEKLDSEGKFDKMNLADILENLQLPSDIRCFIEDDSAKKSKVIGSTNISNFMDGLSFPFLTSSLILAANYTSAKVLYNVRDMLKDFSENIGKFKHPKRMLWLTDTFEDNNGVAMVLQEMHKEIVKRKLPIDILVCSNTLKSKSNLIVVNPKSEFVLPFYKQQPVRIPDFLEIQRVFESGQYDRIMCSTEGFMGLAGLYLKSAFSVKANFYVHTDWIMFAKKVLGLEGENLDQVRRFIRTYYKGFDKLFVLNTDQQKWLMSKEMGFSDDEVKLTAHWVEDIFYPQKSQKETLFELFNNEPVMLFAGRVSKEKGVDEIAYIYKEAKRSIANLKLVVAGNGPELDSIKKEIPEALFLGWVEHANLPKIYSSADILVLPSRFDTFSCAVLESLACGLPVVSYKTKGPKDIIVDGQCGYVVDSQKEMVEKIVCYFENPQSQQDFKHNAVKRAKNYSVDKILEKLISDLEF